MLDDDTFLAPLFYIIASIPKLVLNPIKKMLSMEMIRIAGIKDLQQVLNLDHMGSINSRSKLVREHIQNANCLVYEFKNQIQG